MGLNDVIKTKQTNKQQTKTLIVTGLEARQSRVKILRQRENVVNRFLSTGRKLILIPSPLLVQSSRHVNVKHWCFSASVAGKNYDALTIISFKLTKLAPSFKSNDIPGQTAQQLNHVRMRFKFLQQIQLRQQILEV